MITVIRNLSRGGVVAQRAMVAQGLVERAVGLLNRSSLETDEALVLPRCRSIHTWFMRMPIDVVFLRQGTVVKLAQTLGPFRLLSDWQADTVVELACGTVSRQGLRVGDQLVIPALTTP